MVLRYAEWESCWQGAYLSWCLWLRCRFISSPAKDGRLLKRKLLFHQGALIYLRHGREAGVGRTMGWRNA